MPSQLWLKLWWLTSMLLSWFFGCWMNTRSGWFDPLIQNIAWLNFATHAPGYGQLQPDEVLKDMSYALYGSNGCVAQEKACYAAGNSTSSNRICQDADDYCVSDIWVVSLGASPNSFRLIIFTILLWRVTTSMICVKIYLFYPPLNIMWIIYVRSMSRRRLVPRLNMRNAQTHLWNSLQRQAMQVFVQLFPLSSIEFTILLKDARTWLPQLSALANSGMKILIWVRTSVSTSLFAT